MHGLCDNNNHHARARARFCSACVRLLHSAHSLRDLMDGQEVRVSEANLVAPDGAHIDIAWNFQIGIAFLSTARAETNMPG